jgi:TPR repeat protein
MTNLIRVAVVLMSLGVPVTAGELFKDFEAGHAAYQRGDYATALQLWKPLAERGMVRAMINLGLMYAEGHGVTQDDLQAYGWLSLAAEFAASDADTRVEAQQSRGRIYTRMTPDQRVQAAFSYERQGHGVLIRGDPAMALRLIRWRAEQGDASAQFVLGVKYEFGSDLSRDYSEAMRWYRLSAKQGDAGAQHNIGYLYFNGLGVPQDYSEAMKWYRLAAEHGDAAAQYEIGHIYREGRVVPQDYAEAVKWFRLAAEQNLFGAFRGLGYMYANGLGVPKDDVEAARWYHKPCDIDPEACED